MNVKNWYLLFHLIILLLQGALYILKSIDRGITGFLDEAELAFNLTVILVNRIVMSFMCIILIGLQKESVGNKSKEDILKHLLTNRGVTSKRLIVKDRILVPTECLAIDIQKTKEELHGLESFRGERQTFNSNVMSPEHYQEHDLEPQDNTTMEEILIRDHLFFARFIDVCETTESTRSFASASSYSLNGSRSIFSRRNNTAIGVSVK